MMAPVVQACTAASAACKEMIRVSESSHYNTTIHFFASHKVYLFLKALLPVYCNGACVLFYQQSVVL
jgi:hypothetical protein